MPYSVYIKILALGLAVLLPCSAAFAEYAEVENSTAKAQTEALYESRPLLLKQAENLNRGPVAVPAADGTGILISWRFLATDPEEISFNIYRDGVLLNSTPIRDRTNFLDTTPLPDARYILSILQEGQEISREEIISWKQEYLELPVRQYSRGNYIIDDASAGDLDGDGEYELVVRRTPSDMELPSREAYPLIEAYKLDGTHLWTINIGPNEVNDIDINFLVYDFNGDGKAEVVTRSFELTTDALGHQNGDTDKDSRTNYEESIQKFPDRQYLSEGPEYLSAYDGETGAEIARTPLRPARDPLSEWSARYRDIPRLIKRASHHLLAPAYLNGTTPSIVYLRGAWDNVRMAAWDLQENRFDLLWELNTPPEDREDNIYGAGYHSLAVVDVDFDGKDEILSGSFCVEEDGSPIYKTYAGDEEGNHVRLGHGDAFDVAKMEPDYNGYYVWACHETASLPANIELHDARTGQVLHGIPKDKDTGRSRAADIDPTYPGWEVWGSTGTPLMTLAGEPIVSTWNKFQYRNPDGSNAVNPDGTNLKGSLPMNFKVYWDGDLLSEFLDDTTVSKWNWNDQAVDILFSAEGCASNNGTKAVPCLTADLFGDWREEIVWKTKDNTALRIYSTAIPTSYKLPTLMHDITYREAVAWQNNHYNQPPNTSFYLGAETRRVPLPEVYVLQEGERVTPPVYRDENAVKAYITLNK